MHPMMITALAKDVERERTRESQQASFRSLARQQRRTRAANSPTRAAAREGMRRLLIVPWLLARLS
ncbi:MAG: hypothetical protein ACXVHB_14960 [Solirubrobacteraceae bacterium]